MKFFSITESYWNWEASSEYLRRTMPIIAIIITIIVIGLYSIFH